MMSRKFSNRERAMLLILALILAGGLYYFGVWMPTANSIQAARLEAIELGTELTIEQTKARRLEEMRAKLEEIGYGDNALAITPPFDNVSNVVPLLNKALERAGEYGLRFDSVKFDGNFAIRRIEMSFSASSYRVAGDIIEELATGPYSCDVSMIRIMPMESETESIASGEVQVTLSIVYYEAYTPPVQEGA